MATLAELSALPNDPQWGALVDKVMASSVKKAAAIIAMATPGDGAKAWAISCLSNPQSTANLIIYGIVGSNAAASVSAIYSASDAVIDGNVSDIVDKLYGV